MKQHLLCLVLLVSLGLAPSPGNAAPKRPKQEPATNAPAPKVFAPLPEGHELASLWNDPDFVRRLIGSYGFASDAEPRMQPEEQLAYRTKVVPMLTNDLGKALLVLQSLSKPGDSGVLDFTAGNIYFQHEDFTNAARFYKSALEKFPDYRRAQKNLAFAIFRQEKYSEAIQPLVRTIALGGGDGRVFAFLGFAYMQQGRFASAEAAYSQALIFEPENIDLKLGLVKCSVGSGNYDRALALLDELIKLDATKENLWTLQANIYIQKEQPAKATISFEMLRRLGKATYQNLYTLGDLYMSQECRDLALGAYLDAMERDGGQNPAKALRAAQILVSRGAWDEARKMFPKIRSGKLDAPDELKLLKLESKSAMATGAGSEAIKVLEQIILRNPLDGEALLLAGDYYAKNEQAEKADSRFEFASKIQGFEADAFLKRAQLLVQTQKYAQAAEFLHKAQKIKPRDNVQRYLDKVEQLARNGRS